MTQLGLSRKVATILVVGFFFLFLLTFVLMFIPLNVEELELFRIALSNGPLLGISVASYGYVMRMINRKDTDNPLPDSTAGRLTLVVVWALLGVQTLMLLVTVIDPPLATAEQLQTASGTVATVFGGYLAIIKDTLFPSPAVSTRKPRPQTVPASEPVGS